MQNIYTEKAERALKLAKRASARLKHPYIGTEHLLIGLLEETSGAAGQALQGAGVRCVIEAEAMTGSGAFEPSYGPAV